MANEQISEITTVPTNATVIKIINTLIKRYNSLGSIYTFKGSVQTYDDLLIIQNPNVGDVYNVVQEDEEHQIAAGSNFVWDGTVWDNLGGSLAGLVQSVNGINPDSLGNVLLPLIKNITTNQGVITFTKNDDTTIQVDNIKKLYTVGLGQTVDLNNLVEAGIYICDNDSYAANYENCPVQKSFLLEVQQANDGSMVYQFLTQYNDGSMEAGNQYVRTYQVTNGWTDWVKYVLASDLNGAVDNLTEQVTEVSTALTAHKDDHNNPHQVTAAQLGLATVYKYKGSVETYANLPTSGQQVGDVYNVKQADPDHNIEAGDNVAWDGEKWDILAGDTDLSGYAQLNSANTFTALNAFRANIAVSNGTTAGSGGSISFGISPADETVQARIGTDKLGGLFYNTSTNQPHVFRVGNNLNSFVIRDNGTTTAFSNNNHIFASVVDASGNANWLGNANTATKLETARTINGVSFDGTANITIADSTKLPIAGGTMTGDLTLKGNPTADLMAATKKYVDDSVASAGGGSNLTTYTSLEQLGITPGQETFASIHSALPINSALEYYVSEAQNFADIYPASYGNFIATRLTGDITIFHFTGTNQIIYVTHYHVTNNTNPSWTQIAKQSDLTNLSNSVVKSVNGIKPTNGNVPNIARTDVANNFVTGQKFLKHPTVSGVGGQLFLEKPEVSTLAGDVVIDVMGEMLRFREKGGSGRGFNMNIASGAANCQSPIVTSVNGVKADYTGNIQLKNSNATPVGTILALLDDEVPEGYLPAEGAEISRTTYADLFNVIGTKFGEGDGSTTFNLPNLVGRFLEGDGVPGTLKGPGLPDHNHSILINLDTSDGNGYQKYLPRNTEGSKVAVPSTQASKSNPIYGASDTVQPKSVTVKFCIKY